MLSFLVHGSDSWNAPVDDILYPLITLLPLPKFPCHHRPCLLPFRIVADIYLYGLFQPTYMSRIPLLNGELITTNISTISSIQKGQEKVLKHIHEFNKIDTIIHDIKNNGTTLPQVSFERKERIPTASKSYKRGTATSKLSTMNVKDFLQQQYTTVLLPPYIILP
jgi:hypothetical protein